MQPFHWGYEFDEVMARGGFDAIITNPPWEIFKPQAKEFFADYSNLVSKKKMTINDFEQEQGKLLQDADIRAAWLEYQSRFPYQSAFYRGAAQYQNQIAVVNGKKAGTDINLYKLFVEQCYNLLRDGGQCGIIVPGGVYTDLGAKQVREMLFSTTRLKSLLSMSNERWIFEGVHHAFKFCLLVFEKGGTTDTFRAAFRINPREAVAPAQLEAFLNSEAQHLPLSTALVRRLSPDSLSVMEFRAPVDVVIAEKMLRFPLLGEKRSDCWNVIFNNEFHMTNDSYLFKATSMDNSLPLYEGKMIWQFDHLYSSARYWIDEQKGRKALLGRVKDEGQILDYQDYRIGMRRVASNTNERTLVSTILPKNAFASESFHLSSNRALSSSELLLLSGMLNSLVIDFYLRQRVSANLSMFHIYQLPVPRLTEADPRFRPIVTRAAKQICTTPEYDDLAAAVGLGDHAVGVSDPATRAVLRAELDAMVAHLYGLNETELTHILASFPLVADATKAGVLSAYRAFAPHPDDAQVAALVAAGESDRVEFKESAVWNAHTSKKDGTLTEPIIKAIAVFLNSEGGSVIIGVDKHWNIIGIAADIAAASAKNNADDYERAVRTALSAKLGGEHSPHYSLSFHRVGAQQVLRIAVLPAPAPVYVDGDLYIRDGGGKKKLNAQETVAYVGQRWGK